MVIMRDLKHMRAVYVVKRRKTHLDLFSFYTDYKSSFGLWLQTFEEEKYYIGSTSNC